MITRLRRFWLTAVCFTSIWPVISSVPRCRASGFYQAQAFIFACDGSGGSRESNTVQVQLGAHKTQEILKIPADTSNFMLALSGDGSADIILVDTAQDTDVVPKELKDTGKGEYAGSYKGVDIRYVSSSGAPTKEELTFTGHRTPSELSLRLVNHEGTAADYTLGFYYFPYNGRGSQCQEGAEPVGCEPYHLNTVRGAVVAWAQSLRTKYHDASTAWAQQMQPLTNNFAVPFHHWCPVWDAWPDAAKNGVTCDAAYKFVTGGGLEENVMHFYKDHFDWVMTLPELKTYDDKCCSSLRTDYADEDSAFASVEKVQSQYHLSSQCQAMMKACPKALPAPVPKDYCAYLGVGAASQQSDSSIMHCWKTDDVHAKPLSTSTSGKPLEYVPENTVTTTVTRKTTQPPQVHADNSSDISQANTYLLEPVKSGARELPVTTRTGFSADTWVIISPGGLHQEVNYVNYIGPGSLLMENPTKYDHASGTKISKTSEQGAQKAKDEVSQLSEQTGAVSTSLNATVAAGSTSVVVADESQFKVGDEITFDPGLANEETDTVAGFGSILLKHPLKHAHGPKAIVKLKVRAVISTTRTKILLGAWAETTMTTTSGEHRNEIVPVTFHYETVKDELCAGAAFTNQPGIGCNGWNATTALQCEDKCSNNEQAPNCPQRSCMALSYYPTSGGLGWCHLFEPGQCMSYKPLEGALSSKKVEGGGSGVVMPMRSDGLHTAAVAHPSAPPTAGGPFGKKQVPALVGGVVGGAAVGGALMAGVAAIVANIKGDKAPPPKKGGLLNELKQDAAMIHGKTTTTVTTTISTTTTTTTTTLKMTLMLRIQETFEQSSNSNKPTVPLVCLGLLVVFGLCAVLLAALLDPCQRKKRKVASFESGSVASVGSSYDDYAEYGNSVASIQSKGSSEDMYYADPYDRYGNPNQYDTPSGSSYEYEVGRNGRGYTDYNGSGYSRDGSTMSNAGYPYDLVSQQDYREGLLSPVPEGSLHSSSAGGSFIQGTQPLYGTSQSYMYR